MPTFRVESFIDQRPICTDILTASTIVAAVGIGARKAKQSLKKGRRISQLVVRATKL